MSCSVCRAGTPSAGLFGLPTALSPPDFSLPYVCMCAQTAELTRHLSTEELWTGRNPKHYPSYSLHLAHPHKTVTLLPNSALRGFASGANLSVETLLVSAFSPAQNETCTMHAHVGYFVLLTTRKVYVLLSNIMLFGAKLTGGNHSLLVQEVKRS